MTGACSRGCAFARCVGPEGGREDRDAVANPGATASCATTRLAAMCSRITYSMRWPNSWALLVLLMRDQSHEHALNVTPERVPYVGSA